MTLAEIEARLAEVFKVYAEKYRLTINSDYFPLKIQEELGEMTSAHLKLSERARTKDASLIDLRQNLKDEIADVIAMTMLYAQQQGVDVGEALEQKWFKYLK